MLDLKILIEKYALQNAIKYDSIPLASAVIGKVMAEHEELRSRAREISILASEVITSVKKLSKEERITRLKEIAPELLEKMWEEKHRERGLPELKGVLTGGKAVLRIAPNPNGPPTLGNARGIIINHEYARRYNGKFIMRFDDTDPATKRPMLEAYQWYLEDAEWLGAKPDEVIAASDRIELYYKYAEELIKLGKAYVCFCSREEFKKLKDAMQACPHRETPPEENAKHWQSMLKGNYDTGEAVLRIKTDIQHKDPALRDWVAFRVIKADHPRVGRKYVVWPTLDFESAIEDHLLGTTHIIRGKDLMDSEKRQRYIYEYFGWTYPVTLHWGRIKIHEFGKFSTSATRKAIEQGIYAGWDDPRLPIIRALKRRGIAPEAIRRFIIEMGITETDIAVSMETLYSINRSIIDPRANRYFFVHNPVKMQILDASPVVVKALLHPKEKRGFREIQVGCELFISESDYRNLAIKQKLRLKDLYNIEIESLKPLVARCIGNDLNLVKQGAMIIHWAPVNGIKVKVIAPEGIYEGIGERNILSEKVDSIVQFERFAFCRIDKISESEVIAYWTHK
ncbi:MAG: glutamate--tRNA ligase [Methanocellales archaeon]